MRTVAAMAAGVIGMSMVSGDVADAAELTGTSRIVGVTVFPSGAEVRRTATVKIGQGEHTVLLSDLPAQAIGSSVRVEGKASGKLDIGAVDTRRLNVPRSDAKAAESERRRIETEIEKLRDQRTIFEGQKQAAETQRTLIQNLTQLPTRPAPASGQAAPESWRDVLALIGASSAEAQKTILEAEVNLRETDRKISDLEGALASLAPGEVERTEVKVTVRAAEPVDAELTISYQVPQANWAPLYDARLATGSKTAPPKLDLIRRASITQRTGEPWEGVAIELSTTRPASAAAAPELNPVLVDFVPDAPPPRPVSAPVAGMSRDMALESVPMAAAEAEEGAKKARAVGRMQAAAPIQAEIVNAPFQAIFQVPGKLTVADTGEAKRVELSADSLEPALSIRTVPVREQKAFLYAKLVLPKGAPTLPGAVSLFRDGTFVGTGRLPLLSPGEEHDLGFGADDLVRVKYAIADEKKGETGIISSSRTETRNARITLKSLHARAIPFTVIDQVPVSLQQDIKVDLTARPAPSRQNVEDKRGVVAWDGKLEPEEERTIEHGWRILWPAARSILKR